MTDSLDQLRRAIADRYRIERKLGRGGMATVYLADDKKHGRPVAIKVLHEETAAAIGTERFLREIEVAARMTHPHILPLHDSGAVANQLYYVMPYIEGESLRERIERERQLSVDEALRLTREIASALGYAHRRGLVHRDIKPGNVLLTDGYAMVADFGIARILGASDTKSLTATGFVVGTPAYMAPEQAMGSADVDGRADLYALGCVLYEMLTGQPPFTGRVESLLYQHLNAEPRPVSDVRPGIPYGVTTAIGKALAKVPADRWPTAARFAEALETAGASGLPAQTPPSGSGATPNNLPKQLTHFIGRERELVECADLLAHSRLLTLTGIGGCGKTRLALQLADRLLPTFPDGVWFVDLAPLKDAERVTLTVAAVLGVSETPGGPLLPTLVVRLESRRALIVLDNCEHVLGAAAELAESLLAGCAKVKLLATTREGLGITGEQVFALRSLSLPAQGVTDPQAIGAAEAVMLFVDRARMVEPSFALESSNAPVIAEICRRLDGIPMALALAAARVKMLSPVEIRARLGDRFRLLTGGSKTALPRHQTLRATIGWSYDLMSFEEQRLFCQLSVFAGGCTLEAAMRVSGEGEDEFEVLDLLTRLVAKSLLMPEREAGGTTRYSMLETVRQFAQEKLTESGEPEVARGRHLAYFLSLAEQARPNLLGPDQGAWLARLDRERENLLAAFEWCDRAAAGGEAGLRLAYATQLYWVSRGLLELGHRTTNETLDRPTATGRTLPRLLAAYTAGQLGYLTGRFDDAEARLNEALTIAQDLGEAGRAASVLRALGFVALGRGDRPTARRRFEAALTRARERGEKQELSIVLNALAELERIEGDLVASERLYQEFLALERELGNPSHTASALLNLAMVSIGRGSIVPAAPMLLEALTIAEAIGSKRVGQGVFEAASGLAACTGEWESAARAFGAAEALREQMGLHRDTADSQFLLPWIELARTSMGEPAFAAAEVSGRAMAYEQATAEVRRLLGNTVGAA